MKISKQKLLNIIKEEVESVLKEALEGAPAKAATEWLQALRFWRELFPNGVRIRGRIERFQPATTRLDSGPTRSGALRRVHDVGIEAWKTGSYRERRNHLRKILPNGAELSNKELNKLIMRINNLITDLKKTFVQVQMPVDGTSFPSMKSQADLGSAGNKIGSLDSRFRNLFKVLQTGKNINLAGTVSLAQMEPKKGALSVAKEKGGLSVVDKEDVKTAIADAGKPGSGGWKSRLSGAFRKLGGPLLGIAGIGALWNECEGDLECLAINMMTLVPVKVVKDEEIVDIEPTGRFDASIEKASTGKGPGVSDSW